VALVCDPVIVLDEVDAAAREPRRKLCEPGRREALRLERRAGEGAALDTGAAAQSRKAVMRAAETAYELLGKFRVVERHVLLQRCIAEQHVDELARIVADGRGREPNAHREHAIADVSEVLDLADDLVEDLLVLD